MEIVSEYIHYNIFRKMCESEINRPNNNQINVQEPNVEIQHKKPDIEMGYKQTTISINKQSAKTEVNPIKEKKLLLHPLHYQV